MARPSPPDASSPAATRSKGVAQAGHDPDPSSTHNQVVTAGTRSRTRSMVSTKAPWKTTATASALVHR